MIRKILFSALVFCFANTAFAMPKHIKINNETTGELQISHFTKFNISNLPDTISIPMHVHDKTEHFEIHSNVSTLELIIRVKKTHFLLSHITEDACIVKADLHPNNEPPLIHAVITPLTYDDHYVCTIKDGDTIEVTEPKILSLS